METILDNLQVKRKCQRFTPEKTVIEMLKLANYTANRGIVGKKVLENSFGNGNILIAIVREYILACKMKGLSKLNIVQGLERDIYGIELDISLYNQAIERLNNLTDEFDIPKVNWRLYNVDALFWQTDLLFDFIIGNPPYVSYKDINENNRILLKKKFAVCAEGKFDYCYAFIETAIKFLSENGKLVQLVPNNIYKNVFANRLRELLKPHIKQINIYPAQKLFDEVLTSNSIFLYDAGYIDRNVKIRDLTGRKTRLISRDSLNDKWTFSNVATAAGGYVRFGDFYKASSVIATLLNKAFVISEDAYDQIEAESVRQAVSPKTMHYKKKEYIIFPYKYIGKSLKKYEEQEFEKLFPLATAHLKSFTDELKERKADKNTKWFEYGRSQALQYMNQEKILLSTVITNSVEAYRIGETVIPYAGIYIITCDKKYDLNIAIKILESKDFLSYVNKIGINVNGKSIRITCKDINNYYFKAKDFFLNDNH